MTGFLVRAERPEAFVDRILALANDPALRQRMGAAGRERSLTFDWDEPIVGVERRRVTPGAAGTREDLLAAGGEIARPVRVKRRLQ